jgi:hypothetical protein
LADETVSTTKRTEAHGIGGGFRCQSSRHHPAIKVVIYGKGRFGHIIPASRRQRIRIARSFLEETAQLARIEAANSVFNDRRNGTRNTRPTQHELRENQKT